MTEAELQTPYGRWWSWFDIVLLDWYLLSTVVGMEPEIRQIQVSSGSQQVIITLLGL